MQVKNKFIYLVVIIGFIFFYFFNGGDTSYTFRNDEYLEKHYTKHGVLMGFESAKEYEKRASDLINYCLNNDSCLYKKEEDNDDIYYLEESNEIVFVSSDGYIRTYFLPKEGIDYFNRQ